MIAVDESCVQYSRLLLCALQTSQANHYTVNVGLWKDPRLSPAVLSPRGPCASVCSSFGEHRGYPALESLLKALKARRLAPFVTVEWEQALCFRSSF